MCMVEFIERNGGVLDLGPTDTVEAVADVLVDLAAHRLSEQGFVEWVVHQLGDERFGRGRTGLTTTGLLRRIPVESRRPE